MKISIDAIQNLVNPFLPDRIYIYIYNNRTQYNDINAKATNIINIKKSSADVVRILTETAVECKIDIELQKTGINICRVFCDNKIFQSTLKLKYS